ncbi:DUF3093 domain-containing protein [Paenarthrobacter sp. Z7-10]|uniref:DUF3093 domain-containing protein n=1 Tax=Paenarthrobacter sp. Z7-10 TaxID=2787635 RepID=UPI0022A92A38|nr:DUF3093 domain-containing protein [Paenarthrobacter sp. Z7-10]MCZ2403764.1 DUF3093 domain-containing protein [Paenarthrobacter sp. Z7-10]
MSSEPPLKSAPSSVVTYSERLWPAVWIWVVALGISGAAILVCAPISMTAGYIAGVAVFLVQGILLILSTPRIEVSTQSLQVGRAHIERAFVGKVQPFRANDAIAQRGTALNGLAYLCIRGWVSPVVRIEITDESDRTPYWLASSRRPEQFAAALTAPSSAAQPGH